MKYKAGVTLCLAVVVFGLCGGCNRSTSAPTPLALEQIPGEMRKAFSKARPELQELMQKLTGSLETKDYPAAFVSVQAMCNVADLAKDQRMVTTRSLMTISALVQAAQEQGDQKAKEVLTTQRMTK